MEIFEVLSSAKTPELHSNYLVMIDQCHIFNPAKNRTSEVFGDYLGFTTHYTNNRWVQVSIQCCQTVKNDHGKYCSSDPTLNLTSGS